MRAKNSRHDAIRSLVRSKALRTQEELIAELQEAGFACGKGTIARDIESMGLQKVGGMYVLAEDAAFRRAASQFMEGCETIGNLAIIAVSDDMEHGVARSIDKKSLPDVRCVIVGEGSVLVVCLTEQAALSFSSLVGLLAS